MKRSIVVPGRFARIIVLAAVALSLASCDVVSPTEGLVLPEMTVSFRFEINTDGVSAGETVEVASEESANLEQALDAAGGYTKAEVLSASVTRVELERINPTSVDLGILEEASLALTAANLSAGTVASSSSLPASRSASLPVSGSSDVTTLVIAPSFRGTLTVVPETLPDGVLVLRTTVTLRVEVEGV